MGAQEGDRMRTAIVAYKDGKGVKQTADKICVSDDFLLVSAGKELIAIHKVDEIKFAMLTDESSAEEVYNFLMVGDCQIAEKRVLSDESLAKLSEYLRKKRETQAVH